MLEIPESKVMSRQIEKVLSGKRIIKVKTASSPHKFAWYNGDPAAYDKLLSGKQVLSSRGHGMFVDIICEDNAFIVAGDGTNIRHYPSMEKCPEKYQLQIIFDDNSCIVFTVAMYGGIWACKDEFQNPYYQGSLYSISPLNDAFDESVLEKIFQSTKKDLSMKALLATEQRIPGLGNGVLQDILFNGGIHPKRKKSTLSDFEKGELFHSLKVTLNKMTENGGRDTEKDFFGQNGKYKTILSKNTINQPCPNCSSAIVKEAYLGGAVYYCPVCQKLL
ncbi:MAG: endonuclease VIII [Candidatus Azobacteroides sp.]|nr:endonuclease VIII [Candidatus Azobacteroides sp.]